jgi:ABC-type branched-subunit amino acid transport system ATPase component
MSAGLAADAITVTYGRNVAVDAVSLEVRPGRVVGLIGPNGAGKTSFIDAVTGFTAMSGGTVVLDGTDVTGWAPHRRANRGLRRTFQQLRLFDDLTVRENLVVAAETDTRFGLLRDLVRPRRAAVATDRALELTGLTELADRQPRDLPSGTRRLVGVARAVVAEPTVLLLDEPAAGLDTHETAELGGVLERLADAGVGLLLVEHDTDLVFRVSHDVVAIDFGRTIASGPADEVRRSDALITAYLGTVDEVDEGRAHGDGAPPTGEEAG